MYSILPAIVAFLFLFFGLYVLHSKGLNKVSTAFLVLCVATCVWQLSWAVLYQINDPDKAQYVIKIGWTLILFLPVSLYHFLVILARYESEIVYIRLAYGFSALLAFILLTTNYVTDGHYDYFWGYYPKAGPLLIVHILQTVVVVFRGLYITYRKFRIVKAGEREKLGYCIASVFIYFFAALDYLCNYGVEIYPPGVLFQIISLGTIAVAIAKYHIFDQSTSLAASMAHEMQTPLATLGFQIDIIARHLPQLVASHKIAVEHDLVQLRPGEAHQQVPGDIDTIVETMGKHLDEVRFALDSLLTLTTYSYLHHNDLYVLSIDDCIQSALERMPQTELLTDKVTVTIEDPFEVLASRLFLSYVFINIIKNALDAISEKPDGKITIRAYTEAGKHKVDFEDNGCGIKKDLIPHVFDVYFSSKTRGTNSGIGLFFCKSVMKSFGGNIYCQSAEGKFTRFTLTFPSVEDAELHSGAPLPVG